jgi:hypothetical protein
MMLLARTVLREQAGRVDVMDVQDHRGATIGVHAADAVRREAATQERVGVGDDLRVAGVEREAELLRAGHLGDVAVAQVQAEQLRVVTRVERNRGGRTPAAWTARTRVGPSQRPAHVAHRLPREAEPTGYLAVVDAGRDQVVSRLTERRGMHEHAFADASDGFLFRRLSVDL